MALWCDPLPLPERELKIIVTYKMMHISFLLSKISRFKSPDLMLS